MLFSTNVCMLCILCWNTIFTATRIGTHNSQSKELVNVKLNKKVKFSVNIMNNLINGYISHKMRKKASSNIKLWLR